MIGSLSRGASSSKVGSCGPFSHRKCLILPSRPRAQANASSAGLTARRRREKRPRSVRSKEVPVAAREVFIVGAKRTPIGSFQGAFASVPVTTLGATAIRAALEHGQVAVDTVEETYMGNVLSAGVGQAPARQAAKAAGLPDRVPATTVSKVCGSGLMSVILGTKSVLLGDADVVVAGGMENMTQSPYLLPKGREGYRMGNGQVIDSMV
ncbi:MAG: hypothetical protein KC416_16380, partial [Myxococcales bacterium]|nr:hypothetical protein [Myxococcales bacterium]